MAMAEWSSLEEVLLAEAVQKHADNGGADNDNVHWERVCEELSSRRQFANLQREAAFFTVENCRGKFKELNNGAFASTQELLGSLRAKRVQHLRLCIAYLDQEISSLANGAGHTTITSNKGLQQQQQQPTVASLAQPEGAKVGAHDILTSAQAPSRASPQQQQQGGQLGMKQEPPESSAAAAQNTPATSAAAKARKSVV